MTDAVGLEGAIRVPSIDCYLSMSEVYDRVEFPPLEEQEEKRTRTTRTTDGRITRTSARPSDQPSSRAAPESTGQQSDRLLTTTRSHDVSGSFGLTP